VTTHGVSLANHTALLPPQSHNCSFTKQTNTGTFNVPTAETLIYAHTNSCTLPTCDISLDSLNLPAAEAGEVVEMLSLYCAPRTAPKG
jgi:hypothetical protein